jgi:hypothetical protein
VLTTPKEKTEATMPTKHVDPGDWRTLEWTVNLKCIACFRAPAGAKIKIVKIWSEDEQTLDGTNIKRLILTWGKIQILVSSPADVTYSWDPLAGQPATNFPKIPI